MEVPRFHFIEGALQRTDLARALEGVSHVFHLAGQPGVRKSWGRDFASYTSDNVEATQHLLEAVKGRPIERLVYASSSSVYGDDVAIPMREDARVTPVSPYGVTKLAAEHLCHLYAVNCGVPTVSLRYFTVYGPRQRPDMAFHRFITAAFTDRPVVLYGDGAQTRDFTFVAEGVAATIAAGDRGRPGAVYNIGGGSRVSVNDVLRLVEQRHRALASSGARAVPKGRHARHVCRHEPRARRDWLRPNGRAGRWPGRRSGLAGAIAGRVSALRLR